MIFFGEVLQVRKSFFRLSDFCSQKMAISWLSSRTNETVRMTEKHLIASFLADWVMFDLIPED
jgi:uncharacterized protein YqiB (DUF1249 family)